MTLILQLVGTDLGQEPDASPLLPLDVEQNGEGHIVHHPHEFMKLLAAVTTFGGEHIPREAFRVHTSWHPLLTMNLTLHDCNDLHLWIRRRIDQ